MIPRVIHYCWFGGAPIPEEYRRYIDSWKKYLPDFKIVCHDESNFPLDCDYVRQAHMSGKWAFVSDYARIKIIYEQGGIYLDTDVELVRPLLPIVERGGFMAIEKKLDDVGVNLGLGFGAEAKNPVLYECLCQYTNSQFVDSHGRCDLTTVVTRVTDVLKRHGFVCADRFQRVADITIYPSEFFDPIDCVTGKKRIGADTHAIHHYSASWFDKKTRLKSRVRRLLGQRITAFIIKHKRKIK